MTLRTGRHRGQVIPRAATRWITRSPATALTSTSVARADSLEVTASESLALADLADDEGHLMEVQPVVPGGAALAGRWARHLDDPSRAIIVEGGGHVFRRAP